MLHLRQLALSVTVCMVLNPLLVLAQTPADTPGTTESDALKGSLELTLPPVEPVKPLPTTAPPMMLKGSLQVTSPSPDTAAIPDAEQRVLDPIDLRDMENQDEFEVYDVTLANLIRLIQNRNLDIALAKTGIDQSRGFLTQAISTLLPSLQGNATADQTKGVQLFSPSPQSPSGVFQLNRRTLIPRFSSSYQISLGGRQIYQIKTSQIQLKRSQENVNEMTQKALLDTLTQYFTLLRNTAAVEVTQQSLREASAQRMLNEKRLNSGFGTRLDVMQSAALEEQRKSEVLEAENQKEVANINLVALLDLPISMRMNPEGSDLKPLQMVEDDLNLQQLYGVALQNRPDVKQLQYLIEEARSRYGLARADLFPNLGFSNFYQGLEVKNINSDDSISRRKFRGTFEIQANISWNILQGMGLDTLGDMKVQKAKIQEAILNKEKQINEVQQSLSTAYQNSKLGIAQMRVAYQKMNAAQEEYRISAARLKAGMGINLELIQAQKDLNDARLQYQDACLLYNKAQLQLLFETGQLTVNKMENILTNPFPQVSVTP